jgi:hypothetical protein
MDPYYEGKVISVNVSLAHHHNYTSSLLSYKKFENHYNAIL